MITQITVTKTS